MKKPYKGEYCATCSQAIETTLRHSSTDGSTESRATRNFQKTSSRVGMLATIEMKTIFQTPPTIFVEIPRNFSDNFRFSAEKVVGFIIWTFHNWRHKKVMIIININDGSQSS